MGIVRVFIRFELFMPKDFDITWICQINWTPVDSFGIESPILFVDFGKVFVFPPLATFVGVLAHCPVP